MIFTIKFSTPCLLALDFNSNSGIYKEIRRRRGRRVVGEELGGEKEEENQTLMALKAILLCRREMQGF